MADQPLFDNPRDALVFALNADDVRMPRPAMTTAMATGVKAKLKKAKRRKKPSYDEDLEAALEKEAEMRRLVRAAFRRRATAFSDTEKATQAGFILAELGKLPHAQQVVLTGLLMRSHRPCACRRPCCSGHAIQLRWAKAVEDACLILKDTGEVIRKPGTRGLSTQPGLRRAVVEGFFTKRELTMVELARIAECSQITAAKHKAWIVDYLTQEETSAWERISELLDSAGIVGAIV